MAYEREVRDALRTAGYVTSRHLGQARDGGADLLPIGPYVIEAKRRAALPFLGWMAQAAAACGPSQVPVVICRGDRGVSHVVLRLADFLPMLQSIHPPHDKDAPHE
jgi:hypothetical protein